MAVVLFKCDP